MRNIVQNPKSPNNGKIYRFQKTLYLCVYNISFWLIQIVKESDRDVSRIKNLTKQNFVVLLY